MSVYKGMATMAYSDTKARQVYDVTGAGDTVVGTLALALSAGATIGRRAVMANHAAGSWSGWSALPR